ncbi:MAG: hypothetical protein MJE68_29275 [Proteobacteria bacterium]|nr:hypothetical protein [Pseudomonadota bacterium]
MSSGFRDDYAERGIGEKRRGRGRGRGRRRGREREREKEREGGRERGRERGRKREGGREREICVWYECMHIIHSAKKVLGSCVKVAEGPGEEFSRLLLLFSLTNSWIGGEEDTNFSQLMYVVCFLVPVHSCRTFPILSNILLYATDTGCYR